MENEKGRKPDYTDNAGRVKIAGWTSTIKGKDGNEIPSYNLNLERSYKKADGTWENKNKISISALDVPDVIAMLQKFLEATKK